MKTTKQEKKLFKITFDPVYILTTPKKSKPRKARKK